MKSFGYHKLNSSEAKRMMDEEDVIILDVRTLEEYKWLHIRGSMLIPNDKINSSVLNIIPDLNRKILIYCRSGHRSQEAAEKLVDIGYKNVYEFGGIIDWPYNNVESDVGVI